jgi:hypothetical protein
MTAAELVGPAAAAPTAMAALVVAVGFLKALLPGRDTAAAVAGALALALELLLAAALIRLATVDSPAALGGTALVLVVRGVAVRGLRYARRGVDGT